MMGVRILLAYIALNVLYGELWTSELTTLNETNIHIGALCKPISAISLYSYACRAAYVTGCNSHIYRPTKQELEGGHEYILE
jgi:hypothetical protein